MGLIICPDCGKEVSDQAPACIHCGRPLQAVAQPVTANDLRAIAQEEAVQAETWRKQNNKKRFKALGLGVPVGIVLCFVVIFFDDPIIASFISIYAVGFSFFLWLIVGLIGGFSKIDYFLGKLIWFSVGMLIGSAIVNAAISQLPYSTYKEFIKIFR